MLSQRLMWILWPAFLGACGLEMLVFAFVDPHELQWLGEPLHVSRQAIYTVAFFMFWGCLALVGSMTTLLSRPSFEINHCAH